MCSVQRALQIIFVTSAGNAGPALTTVQNNTECLRSCDVDIFDGNIYLNMDDVWLAGRCAGHLFFPIRHRRWCLRQQQVTR